ncbi:MAG: hydroxyacid dehydrogenase, partial [Hyphomicrobiales bacterium]|nr:hydroxyacid dehydrogenase [Hyphomicrobiales bacterium]
MAKVFLTHVPEMLENYYGARAVSALREFADVALNTTGRVLDARGLAVEAQGCEIIIS